MKYAHIIKNLSQKGNLNINETLRQINQFSRRPLSEDEIFIFSIILCDNEIDRDFERFTDQSLDTLKSLFLGKTGVFDHIPTGSNQTSRIFFTEVITDNNKKNSIGQPYKYLLAKAYMVRSDKNKDLILEIDAGIKKEISIGCSVKSKICSICGTNHKINPCDHILGQNYLNIDNKQTTCFLSLENPTDAYEWSFVAVPSQVNAGVIKNFTSSITDLTVINSKNLSEIKKSLKSILTSNQSCFITHSTIKSLNNYITKLESDSKIAQTSIKDLKTQVFKMLSISQPTLTTSTINTIIDNISYQELQDLKTNLISKLEIKSISPQLTPISSQSLTNNISDYEDNTMFSI